MSQFTIGEIIHDMAVTAWDFYHENTVRILCGFSVILAMILLLNGVTQEWFPSLAAMYTMRILYTVMFGVCFAIAATGALIIHLTILAIAAMVRRLHGNPENENER